VPPWAEVYPSITGYPAVLQALLAPAATPEKYYKALLNSARQAGLEDQQTLLGLLWHAPLGGGGQQPQRREYFQRLISQSQIEQSGNSLPYERGSLTGDAAPFPNLGDTPPAPEEDPLVAASDEDQLQAAGFPSAVPGAPSRFAGSRCSRNDTKGYGEEHVPEGEDYIDSWTEFFRFSQENLVVDRRRYEAMIYELGKLGAWQEFFKKQDLENKGLREKIEAHWARELEFLRQLSTKNNKKGWRKW